MEMARHNGRVIIPDCSKGLIGKLETIILADRDNNRAEFAYYGAHPMSLRIAGDARDIFFVSPTSVLDGSGPVRGGMPNCFPWFGAKPGSSLHGPLRNQVATVQDFGISPAGHPFVTFEIRENDQTMEQWPNRFVYTATHTLLENGLATRIEVENCNDTDPFTFQLALHSYFSADASTAKITGLQGRNYTDKLLNANPVEAVDDDPFLVFKGYTDRVYREVPDRLQLETGLRKISVEGVNLPDAVAWCAFGERSDLADLPVESQLKYCCLERGAIAVPVELAPGQKWFCIQTIGVSYSSAA